MYICVCPKRYKASPPIRASFEFKFCCKSQTNWAEFHLYIVVNVAVVLVHTAEVVRLRRPTK